MPEPEPPRAASLAARVPLVQGEATRRRLAELGVLRPDLKPRAEGASLLLPVLDAARDAGLGLELTTTAFEPQEGPGPRYQELARVPGALKSLLPTSFDVVGDIVLIKLPRELEPHQAEVGRALLQANKAARTVLLDRGVRGEARVRQVECIAGEPRTATEHTEYGARFRVDLAKAYFSPRLATEHQRVAEIVQAGEVVLDMFAGVGPFAVLIARQGKAQRVYAVDSNPDAVKLLEENARLNKVQDRVAPVLADADTFARGLAGRCDRVVMNLPQSADEHWEAALAACRARAVVHYHRVLAPDAVAGHVAALQERAAGAGFEARLLAQREVRLYSPSQSHWAVDLEVRRKPTA